MRPEGFEPPTFWFGVGRLDKKLVVGRKFDVRGSFGRFDRYVSVIADTGRRVAVMGGRS